MQNTQLPFTHSASCLPPPPPKKNTAALFRRFLLPPRARLARRRTCRLEAANMTREVRPRSVHAHPSLRARDLLLVALSLFLLLRRFSQHRAAVLAGRVTQPASLLPTTAAASQFRVPLLAGDDTPRDSLSRCALSSHPGQLGHGVVAPLLYRHLTPPTRAQQNNTHKTNLSSDAPLATRLRPALTPPPASMTKQHPRIQHHTQSAREPVRPFPTPTPVFTTFEWCRSLDPKRR